MSHNEKVFDGVHLNTMDVAAAMTRGDFYDDVVKATGETRSVVKVATYAYLMSGSSAMARPVVINYLKRVRINSATDKATEVIQAVAEEIKKRLSR